jgi:predicted GIY-YIG superfamily endonuclease
LKLVYRVYIVRNPQLRHYIGLSDDVTRRVEQHNHGVSQWTRSRGPWELIWTSDSLSLSNARKLENLLKRQKGGAGFYRLTGLIPPTCS